MCRIAVIAIPYRSSPPEVFLGKGGLKICSKLTGEHPCRSLISIKLQRNFYEITLRHGCSLVNLLHIFGTPFPRKTSGGLLLSLEHLKTNVPEDLHFQQGLAASSLLEHLVIYLQIVLRKTKNP